MQLNSVWGDLYHLQLTLYMVGREDERTNNRTTLKNKAPASYKVSVKIEFLKGAGLL